MRTQLCLRVLLVIPSCRIWRYDLLVIHDGDNEKRQALNVLRSVCERVGSKNSI